MAPILMLAMAAAQPAPMAQTAPMANAAPAACPAVPAPPPPELAGWQHGAPLAAGASAAGAPLLPLGRGTAATLPPAAGIAYALPPARPGGPETRGGLYAFAVPAAARYRVALGAAAWIDVVSGGKAVASATHAHGPACTGIRKMVDFDLAPGRYLLQISGATAPSLALMVVRLP